MEVTVITTVIGALSTVIKRQDIEIREVDPNLRIIKIGQNTKKSVRNLRRSSANAAVKNSRRTKMIKVLTPAAKSFNKHKDIFSLHICSFVHIFTRIKSCIQCAMFWIKFWRESEYNFHSNRNLIK